MQKSIVCMLPISLVMALLSASHASTDFRGLHAGILEIPDFDRVLHCHFPGRQDEYYNPYNPNNEEKVKIFGLPKFHRAHGAAYHTDEDPEHASVAKRLTRVGSVSEKLYAGNIGQVLEICPGASQPILRGQLSGDRLRKVFAVMDTDGSGDLDLNEITECFHRLGLQKTEEEVVEMMRGMDGDADKRVTFREFESSLRRVAARAARDGLLDTLQLHPGTWITQLPDEIPNLDIPAMDYRSQWVGEEKMGGGWSSDSHPLSGDRPRDWKEGFKEQKEMPDGKHSCTDAEGNVNVVNRKTAQDMAAGGPTSAMLRGSTMLI